jgi:hypothetical protein
MANAMRKMAEYLGLVDGSEYNDEFGTYADADMHILMAAGRPTCMQPHDKAPRHPSMHACMQPCSHKL